MVISVHPANIAVFAGPSLWTHFHHPEVKLFPPASAGDIQAAYEQGFTHVVLADTLFFDATPTHREIMGVLRNGMHVVGCSSAGALRAVELQPHGMKGWGTIFHVYRLGLLTDDGELACTLDDKYCPVFPPLIQIRYFLGYLSTLGVSTAALESLFAAIRNEYFMIRTNEVFSGADPNLKGGPPTAQTNQALAIEQGYDYEFVTGTGHLLQIEKPLECAQLVQAFLSECGMT